MSFWIWVKKISEMPKKKKKWHAWKGISVLQCGHSSIKHAGRRVGLGPWATRAHWEMQASARLLPSGIIRAVSGITLPARQRTQQNFNSLAQQSSHFASLDTRWNASPVATSNAQASWLDLPPNPRLRLGFYQSQWRGQCGKEGSTSKHDSDESFGGKLSGGNEWWQTLWLERQHWKET